jgi:2-phospho-L-lactate/phosphoenolpyruvate guanylyltransferase
MPQPTGPHAAIVIPLRSFAHANTRLATLLDDNARERLARDMADRVLRAAGDMPTVIVTSAPEVSAWATAKGCTVVADPGSLDAAAAAGRAWARDHEIDRVVIAHADLPLVESFATVTADGAAPVAVVVPDHRDDGNPVLSLPAAAPFEFAYGPGSAERHAAEAQRCGLEVRIVRDRALGFDLDLPADLDALDALDERVR